MYKPISHVLHSFLLLVLIGTIGSIVYTVKSTSAAQPVETRQTIPTFAAQPVETQQPTPTSSVAGAFESGRQDDWSTVRRGLERRVVQIYDRQNRPVETVHIWRLDQDDFRLDVAFDKRPKSLEAWQAETKAAMVVNGGYFSIVNEQYFADGLTVLNGAASGRSFTGYGGMLAVLQGDAELRSLVQRPYDPNERLDAALQAFPVLVTPGGGLGYGSERETYARARRTVIAQDREGRILFILTPQGHFTLHEISAYLTASDLNLDIAINLDGGSSTGIIVAEPREVIPSRLLPFVILVYEK